MYACFIFQSVCYMYTNNFCVIFTECKNLVSHFSEFVILLYFLDVTTFRVTAVFVITGQVGYTVPKFCLETDSY